MGGLSPLSAKGPAAMSVDPASPPAPAATPRAFVALWPRPEDAFRLAEAADLALAAHRPPGRRMPPVDLHLTLAFIGALDEAGLARTRDVLRASPSPADSVGQDACLTIDRLGGFRGGIAWLGPSTLPDWLEELARTVRGRLREAGIPFDAKPFVPHVTVRRNAGRVEGTAIPPLPATGWRLVLARPGPPDAPGRYLPAPLD